MKTKNDVRPFFRPACEAGWPVESTVRAIAGLLVLVGLGLSFLDLRWLWLVAFVGVNLLQSGLSGWCLLSNVIAALARSRPT